MAVAQDWYVCATTLPKVKTMRNDTTDAESLIHAAIPAHRLLVLAPVSTCTDQVESAVRDEIEACCNDEDTQHEVGLISMTTLMNLAEVTIRC